MSHGEAITAIGEPHGAGLAFVETVPGVSPAAGVNYQLPQDGRYISLVLFAACRLVTDANVANRFLTLDYTDVNGNVYASAGAAVLVTAGTTVDYRFSHGRSTSEWTTNNIVMVPLGEDYMQPGEQVQINVASKQVGDQLSAIFVRVERFETGPRGPLGHHHRHPRLALAHGRLRH